MAGLEGYDVALDMRDIIERLATRVIDRERPRYQMAIVTTIDRLNRKCEVQFPGDTTTVWVKMGSVQPSTVGQTVRVAGVAQDRYIEDVIGQPWIEGVVEDLGTQVQDKIKTFYATSGSPPTATAVGDLWVVTDLGALYRWNGTGWVDTGLASSIQVKSKGVDLITNGTGYLLNNTNFIGTTFNSTDFPPGVSGSFYTETGVQTGIIITERIPFNPALRYRFSFQARQTIAGKLGRMYGFIAPYDRFDNPIEVHMYAYITGTTTTLAAPLNPGNTTITLTSSANWFGSASRPAGEMTHNRKIMFWNYTDALGKVWPVGSYTRNFSDFDAWADGGISGNVITLRTPWAGPAYAAGTPVSNSTSGGTYMYMPSCNNAIVPETWTQYADTFEAGILTPAEQQGESGGGAQWTTGAPPGTAKFSVGWLVNFNETGSRHAIAAVQMSEASAANQEVISKNATFYSSTTPTANAVGDLWIDSDDKKLYRWSTFSPRANLCTNPSFETNTTGWTAYASTLTTSTTGAVVGSNSLRIAPNAGSTDSAAQLAVTLLPNTTYTVSATIHIPVTLTGSEEANRARRIYAYLNGVMYTSAAGSNAGGTTQRLSVTFTTPATINTSEIRLYNGYSNSAANHVHWDAVLVEASATLGSYFDGSSANSSWTGTEHNSASSYAPSPSWVEVSDSRFDSQATAITDIQDSLATMDGRIDGKAVIWYQPSAPGSLGSADTGDIWIDSDDPNRLTKMWDGDSWENITDQKTLDVLTTVNTKITTFYAADAPTATAIGDLWIDSDDKRLYRATAADASHWVEVTDNRVAQATTDIATIQNDLTGLTGQLDGKSTIYVQSTAPGGLDAQDQGDIWINTATTDRIPSVWDGDSWELITDATSIEALAAVQTKITTFYQNEPPTAEGEGDLWIDTNDSKKLYRWSSYDPADVSKALWWRNDELTGAQGSSINSWDDASPNNRDATVGSGAPTVATAATPQGGKAANFSGSGQDFVIPTIPIELTNLEYWIVIKPTSSTNGFWTLGVDASLGSHFPYSDGKVYDHCGANQRQSFTPTMTLVNNWRRYRVRLSGGVWTAFLDGVQQATASGRTRTNPATSYLGDSIGASMHFQGQVAEFAVIDHAMTDNDAAKFDDYLNKKHIAGGSYVGGGWVAVDDERIAAMATTLTGIQTEITGLSGRIDGKSTVYVQGTQPHDSNLSTDIGDIWIDTSSTRVIKTYNGSDWVISDDTRLALALSTANSKITTYYSSTAPVTGLVEGDLWVRTGTNLIYRYDLDTTTWEPLTVTAGALSPGVNDMAGQKLYDTFSDFSAWTKSGAGTVTVVQTSDAETGGYVFQCVGETVLYRNGVNGPLIPFDPSVLYRVTYRLRQTVNPTGGGSLVYLGLAGYAADGTTLVNVTGANDGGNQHYFVAAAKQIVVADGWQTITGFVKGRSTAGTSTARPTPIAPGVMHNNVRYVRPVAFVNLSGGNGTVQLDLVTVEVVEVGAVAGDNLKVGSIGTEKIAMWAFNKNLVPDPSFEEPYALVATTNTWQWRTSWILGTGFAERSSVARSGKWAGRIGITSASGTDTAALYCGNFPVTPGNTYNVQINAAKERYELSSKFYARIGGGSTDDLTEYPGAPFTNAISWNGDAPDFVANLDLQWIGQNLWPNPFMLDQDADTYSDPSTAYSSGTITGGVRSVTVASGEFYGQNLGVSTVASGGRWGTQTALQGMEMNRSYKMEMVYSLSGDTNARLRVYIDTYDSADGIRQSGLGVTLSPGTNQRTSFTIPADATAVKHLVYVWIEPAAGQAISASTSATWTMPLYYKIDANGMIDPDTPQYQTVSGSFTAPAGITRATIHFMCNDPDSAQSIFLDDISVLESGQGGSELTSAGLRLFGNDGDEAVALVSNRKNYFTVQEKGKTLASISDEGTGSFVDLSLDADPEVIGFQLLGNLANYKSPVEAVNLKGWLDSLPRGVCALDDISVSGGTYTTYRGLFELSWLALPGRTYRISFTGAHVSIGNTVDLNSGFEFRHVGPSTIGGEAANPNLSNTNVIMYSQMPIRVVNTEVTLPAVSRIMRCNISGDTSSGGELTAGINKLLIAVTGSRASITVSSGFQPHLYVEDIGPDIPRTGVLNASTTGSPVSNTTKMTYTTTWTSTNACCYMGSGAKDSSQGPEDMKQGYSSYDGDSRSLWIFPNTIYSTVAGSTITKVRVYLYANHWYYNAGGTARIKYHNLTSIPATLSGTSPMTAIKDSTGWPMPGGRWVDITTTAVKNALLGNTFKGIGVGPANTTSATYYGRFNKAGAKIEVTYTK